MKKIWSHFINVNSPGLFPGMAAGLMLGLQTQLHYLGFVAWEVPYWRIIGGVLGGVFLGTVLTVLLGKGISRLIRISPEPANRSSGYGLCIVTLVGLLIWNVLADHGLVWILFVFWIVLSFSLIRFFQRIENASFSPWEPRFIIVLLTGVLILGLSLRFSGLTHGLPEYIVHCDTPKQLCLIPGFVEGDLTPPGRYPIGHIYLYAGAIKLWRAITGVSTPLPEYSHETMIQFVPTIISVRVLQGLLSAAIPFFVFLIGRNLWGPWTGLLAAFLVACDPVHLTYTRQEMGELPQTFWVMVSFFFASRIFRSGTFWDCFLAGIFAGLATATKMYGGYIILAALGAIVLAPSRPFRKIFLVLGGLITGLIVGSPYLWVDPQGWWSNVVWETIDEIYVRTPKWDSQRWALTKRGITYLWQGLTHRFHLPFILLSLLSLGFLVGRHRKNEVFFLIPLTASFLLIGFSITYIREWDFVNLTPYLALAVAPFVVWIIGKGKDFPFYRRLTAFCLAVFLIFQGLIVLGDALVARFPDTRHLARRWVLRYVDSGSRMLYDTSVSGAVWIPVKAGLSLTGISGRKLLDEKSISTPDQAQIAAVERVWWEPPLSSRHYQPIQVFDLRNTFWENPIISFYRLDNFHSSPQVILPHTRVRLPEPAFLDTPWAQRQPMDLLSLSNKNNRQFIFSSQPSNPLAYALLGNGQARISFGPALGFPAAVNTQALTTGLVKPLRRLHPLYPRTYEVSIVSQKEEQKLWLGLYPRPEGMSPLLLRFAAWPELERMASLGLTSKDAPAELSLFYATALVAQGKEERAKQELEHLYQRHPDFLPLYRRLATGQEKDFNQVLGQLAQATQAELSNEEVYWPKRSGDLAELDQIWPNPGIISEERLFHLWLPQTFLPGFITAKVQFGPNPNFNTNPSRLIVVAVQSKFFIKELIRIELKKDLTSLDLPLQIPTGPIRLEFRLESDTPCRPQITSVQIKPDYPSEIQWRWKVFTKYLKELNLE